ncbi:MAG: hypothetical protein AB9866_05470 [Syntrophobacteraceae bacterium]
MKRTLISAIILVFMMSSLVNANADFNVYDAGGKFIGQLVSIAGSNFNELLIFDPIKKLYYRIDSATGKLTPSPLYYEFSGCTGPAYSAPYSPLEGFVYVHNYKYYKASTGKQFIPKSRKDYNSDICVECPSTAINSSWSLVAPISRPISGVIPPLRISR